MRTGNQKQEEGTPDILALIGRGLGLQFSWGQSLGVRPAILQSRSSKETESMICKTANCGIAGLTLDIDPRQTLDFRFVWV